jgi:hypothetical protein
MKKYAWGWKQEKKSQVVCGQSFKTILKVWKITMGTLYQKKCFSFEISSYILKVAIKKLSWKFTMFQESFYMFKTFKKSM